MTAYSYNSLNYASIDIGKTILYLGSGYRQPNVGPSLSRLLGAGRVKTYHTLYSSQLVSPIHTNKILLRFLANLRLF